MDEIRYGVVLIKQWPWPTANVGTNEECKLGKLNILREFYLSTSCKLVLYYFVSCSFFAYLKQIYQLAALPCDVGANNLKQGKYNLLRKCMHYIYK